MISLFALTQRIYLHLLTGELDAAASLVEEIQRATETTGSDLAPYAGVGLAALRGREIEAEYLIERTRTEVTRRGEGIGLSVLDWAAAVLYNGLRQLRGSMRSRSGRRRPRPQPLDVDHGRADRGGGPGGNAEVAADARRQLGSIARASGTDWVVGIASRSEALLAEGAAAAEHLYLAAIDRLGRTRIAVDLARAHLLYGEWLRRERRRADARVELRFAHERFSDFGMEAFTERARIELLATGEHARKRTIDTSRQLTPQEAQISRLAAKGNTNREIAAQLFISPKTVEYHLRKAFRKLDVKSRAQLASRIS